MHYQERPRGVREPPRWPCRRIAGRCQLCCSEVPRGRRTWCSQRCVDLWWLATTPDEQRRHLMAFFAGCWECGARYWSEDGGWAGVELEVEHTRPLWSLSAHERDELKWWLPYNLQLLCTGCHRAKSRREAAERALLARGARAELERARR